MIGARLIPILFVVGAIGLFFGYMQPTYNGAITELQGEIQELDMALLAAQRFSAKQLQLSQQREQVAPEELARLEAFLPDSVDNVQLIVDLNSLAARSGVTLSDFDIANSEGDNEGAQVGGIPEGGPVVDGAPTTLALSTGEPVDSLELSVAATGSYAAFRTFLEGVEKSLRPLDIIELTVDDSTTGVYTYDITFRLYWLR